MSCCMFRITVFGRLHSTQIISHRLAMPHRAYTDCKCSSLPDTAHSAPHRTTLPRLTYAHFVSYRLTSRRLTLHHTAQPHLMTQHNPILRLPIPRPHHSHPSHRLTSRRISLHSTSLHTALSICFGIRRRHMPCFHLHFLFQFH